MRGSCGLRLQCMGDPLGSFSLLDGVFRHVIA
jgi:hypothetical protein